MALFDKDNPGKNLANARIWLDSAKGSDRSGGGGYYSGDSDKTPYIVGLVIGAIFMVPVAILYIIGVVFH